MELASDITPEDLKVFLEEADEQLQLLDDSILKLEQQGEDPDLLQEIFRAAHTLKGSSGMLGYGHMAEVGHAMESVLDLVRKGSLPITTEVIDALLQGLDVLRLLKQALVDAETPEPDIRAAVIRLEAVVDPGADVSESPPQKKGKKSRETAPAAAPDGATLDAAAVDMLQTGLSALKSAFRVELTVHEEATFPAARLFQVINEVTDLSEILGSSQSIEQILEGTTNDPDLELILLTGVSADRIAEAIGTVAEIKHVKITPYRHDEGPPAEAAQAPQPTPKAAQSPALVDDAVAAADQPPPNRPSTQNQPGARTEADATPPAAGALKSGSSQTVRIDVERLDSLMNLIGELVIDRTRIAEISRSLEVSHRDDRDVASLAQTSSHIIKVVDQLQEEIMKIRMLPIGTVFNAFPRMMRDLAHKMNKQVEFVVEGQDTEIDRTVIERIRDPLVHLLRNSIDHGVESAEERAASGKAATARIRLNAYQEQGHIFITVEDDGRGIDANKVRDSAVEKGLITTEAADRLTEADALDLIFLAGNSTSANTTEISGRGVGMDIVKTNIEAIHGFVSVETKVGAGTTIRLRLPLTLATLQAVLVTLGPSHFAIPVVYVLELVRLDQAKVNTVGGQKVMRLRDRIIPLLHASAVFSAAATPERNDGAAACVVVMRAGDRLVGLVVDSVLSQQDFTVKSLSKYVGDVKSISGASILADGRVVLIVDVPSMVNLVTRAAATSEKQLAA